MAMPSPIRVYAEAASATRSRGLMRTTGWEVPGGSSTGGSFEVGAKFGGGYASLPVRKSGMPFQYVLTGGYVEVGVGIGLDVKAELFGKVAERIWKCLGVANTDGGIMPSGSISELYFGPLCTQAGLGHGDLENSTWLYLNLNGTSVLIGGDVGLLMLLDPAAVALAYARQLPVVPEIVRLTTAIYCGCKAWCVYGGTAFAGGVGVGAGARVVQMTKFDAELTG